MSWPCRTTPVDISQADTIYSVIHFYFAAAEALHIVTTRESPFKSLAAEYTPLTEDYTGDVEEGS